MLSGVPPQVTLKPRLAKITAQRHLKAFAKFAPGLARSSVTLVRPAPSGQLFFDIEKYM
jgi:hypothetical protein